MNVLNRRHFLQSTGAVSVSVLPHPIHADEKYHAEIVQKHDGEVQRLLSLQITDHTNRWRGGYADQYGLVHSHSAANLLKQFIAAYGCEQSNYYKDQSVIDRIHLAAEHLNRMQNEQGNIDLVTTNFNSPPDTGFVVHNAGTAAHLAQKHKEDEILQWIKPFLLRAGHALTVGGIHTPNHRWVVCAALAQIHELFPDETYVQRINQWLAEGIDIDEDGMYTERSTTVYNAVTNNALVTIAHKLKRMELLEPVRKNLDAMQYLLHPNGEVVTEISRRQDSNTRGDLRRYWFALRYLAIHDRNGRYAAMLQPHEPQQRDFAALMEYPELNQPLPETEPIPTQYEKIFAAAEITRIREDKMSATVIHTNSSRLFSLHHGDAVINAVRMAAAFFGKGQLIPQQMERRGDVFYFKQSLSAPYYQPLIPSRIVAANGEAWSQSRLERKQSGICYLYYEVELKRVEHGFELMLKATGTNDVPVSVEINLREGGELKGVTKVNHTDDAWLLSSGMAEYQRGGSVIRFGPGKSENTYIQVRGAEDKLPGPSVYLTGYTPMEHTILFECVQ